MLEKPPDYTEPLEYKRALNSAKVLWLESIQKLPGHTVSNEITKTKRDKKISFAKDLNIRFQISPGNKEIHDFSQPLIDEEDKIMSTVYLMFN